MYAAKIPDPLGNLRTPILRHLSLWKFYIRPQEKDINFSHSFMLTSEVSYGQLVLREEPIKVLLYAAFERVREYVRNA